MKADASANAVNPLPSSVQQCRSPRAKALRMGDLEASALRITQPPEHRRLVEPRQGTSSGQWGLVATPAPIRFCSTALRSGLRIVSLCSAGDGETCANPGQQLVRNRFERRHRGRPSCEPGATPHGAGLFLFSREPDSACRPSGQTRKHWRRKRRQAAHATALRRRPSSAERTVLRSSPCR